MELVSKYVGGCVPAFLAAVVFDVVGLVILFVGIFANVRIDDRFYGDFLIYTGSLLMFFSVFFWLFWYVGNVRVTDEDMGMMKKSNTLVRLARKLSERFSSLKLKGEERVKRVEDGGGYAPEESPAPPHTTHKASKVTWGRAMGKSVAYRNDGYDDSMDSPTMEKKIDLESDYGYDEYEGKQEINTTTT